jgi:hypothetical protein
MDEKTRIGLLYAGVIMLGLLAAIGLVGTFYFKQCYDRSDADCRRITAEQQRAIAEAEANAKRLDDTFGEIKECADSIQGNLSGLSVNNQSDAERLRKLKYLLHFIAVKTSKIQNAVVDYRGNSGGDNCGSGADNSGSGSEVK